MARELFAGILPAELFSYRVQLVALDASGVPQTGLTPTVRRTKPGEGASTLITPTITEVDAVNAPGLYELTLDSTDMDVVGNMTLLIEDAAMEDLYLHLHVESRSKGMAV